MTASGCRYSLIGRNPPTLLRRASPWGVISAPPGEAEEPEKGESNALPTCARNPSPLRAYIRPQNPTPRNPPQSLGHPHALTKKLAKSEGCNKFPTSSPDLISDLGVLRILLLGAKRLMQIRDPYISVFWEIVRTVSTIGAVIVSCFVLGVLTLIFPWLEQFFSTALITIILVFVGLGCLWFYRFLRHNNQLKGSDPNNRNDDQDGLGKPAPILPISPLQGAAANHVPKEKTQQSMRGNRR